ncbi:MAG TPA: hypothetical protein VE153_17470 [Myxococcus sp.]|nr:hypothetical protein [Myxococcus sp.]
MVRALGLVVFSMLACARPPPAPPPPLVAPGTYNGRPPKYVGLLQLTVREDGTATFLNVVSVHLPPRELERREVKLERGADGRVCMNPAPDAVEPCLAQEQGGALTVKTKDEGTAVLLEPVPAQ